MESAWPIRRQSLMSPMQKRPTAHTSFERCKRPTATYLLGPCVSLGEPFLDQLVDALPRAVAVGAIVHARVGVWLGAPLELCDNAPTEIGVPLTLHLWITSGNMPQPQPPQDQRLSNVEKTQAKKPAAIVLGLIR